MFRDCGCRRCEVVSAQWKFAGLQTAKQTNTIWIARGTSFVEDSNALTCDQLVPGLLFSDRRPICHGINLSRDEYALVIRLFSEKCKNTYTRFDNQLGQAGRRGLYSSVLIAARRFNLLGLGVHIQSFSKSIGPSYSSLKTWKFAGDRSPLANG